MVPLTTASAFASAIVSAKEAPTLFLELPLVPVPEVPVPAEVPVPVEVLLPAPARSALAPALVTTFWFTFAVTSLS